MVSVFDVSQTEGAPLIEMPYLKIQIKGNAPYKYKANMKKLSKHLKTKLIFESNIPEDIYCIASLKIGTFLFNN